MEPSWTENVARTSSKTLGSVPAGRFIGTAGNVEPADRHTRCRRATCGGKELASKVADDATGRGSEYGAGLCADHGRREPLPARQAGRELSGTDSTRGKFGGTAEEGAITKQGNRMLRSLLVEAAQIAVRYDPGFRKQYLHRYHHKPKGVAKVAAARKLAVRLYWMLRTNVAYPEIVRIESSPRVPLVGAS